MEMNMLQLAVINRSHHPLPQYETPGAAGLDLRAFLPEPVTLKSLERKLIPTGLYLEIPMGYEAQIRPRSGLAIKKGLTLVNTPGTIDSDYRGELLVPVINLSAEDQAIEDGDRIAQMILSRHETVSWLVVEQLEASTRGEGGFGHTGNR
jgi:dUTP pyrophosphatase